MQTLRVSQMSAVPEESSSRFLALMLLFLVCFSLLLCFVARACRYAEETGDYAQQRELQSVIEALDSDGDGCIGLLDFVLFAARRKVNKQ